MLENQEERRGKQRRGKHTKYRVHINNSKGALFGLFAGLALGIVYASVSFFFGVSGVMSFTFGLIWPFFPVYGCVSLLIGFLAAQKTGKSISGSLEGIKAGFLGMAITYLSLFSAR
jgi:hypothetical protein